LLKQAAIMSVNLNPALVAARAYVRPSAHPVKAGFVIDSDASPARQRGMVHGNRRTAPAIEISLSPEALDLLAKARANARDDGARTGSATSKDAVDTRGAGLSFDDFVAAQNSTPVSTYSTPGTRSDRAFLQPGSQLDITL
jgi:hypothetical protein